MVGIFVVLQSDLKRIHCDVLTFKSSIKMNLNLALNSNTTNAQAYLWALSNIDMQLTIWALQSAIYNPQRDTRHVLFEYYRTMSDPNIQQRYSTYLPNGMYLDNSFNSGLFDALKSTFAINNRKIELYTRRRMDYDVYGIPHLNPHIRQVVMVIRSA
jgi:hypothetical protein